MQQERAPNMESEVIEAIQEYFKTVEPEIAVDCLLYLRNLYANEKLARQLRGAADIALERMGRCAKCGEELQVGHYREWHDEVDGGAFEEMSAMYCPYCDIGGGCNQ